MSRLSLAVVLAALACLPSMAHAGATILDPYRYAVTTRPAGYWGYRSYWNSYWSNYADNLRAIGDYARAEGDYLIKREKARRLYEENRQFKLETRRKELEQYKWERDFIWNMHREYEQKVIRYEAERAIHTPTLTEILSGGMLNILHRELSKLSRSPESPSVPIREEWLENINFTATGGNTGLLRQKELSWPVLIQDDRLASTRVEIERHLDAARREAGRGKVSGKTIEALLDLKNRLDEEATELLKASRAFGPRHHIQASRFTKELNQALLLLENPKEAAFMLGARPQSKTVAELVQFMRDNGLTFGPASAGSERYYVSLHDKMAEEARSLERRPANPEK